MDNSTIIAFGFLILAIIVGLGIAYYLLIPRSDVNMKSLMGKSDASPMNTVTQPGTIHAKAREEMTPEELALVKRQAERKVKGTSGQVPLETKFFYAGIFTELERSDFYRMRTVLPFILAPIMGEGLYYFAGPALAVAGLVMGGLLGFQFPVSMLDRRIKDRQEEIMFFLPLVIEQIAIGVSSSLDIGPCLQRVVSMADERDSHNVVTELIKHTQHYIKSGVSLEEAFTEVGKMSGSVELKHAFMSIAQVAKHGGEVTRQLQELADSVSAQRETRIEAKIKKLELEATGPVALVFAGFLVLLLYGFGYQIVGAFG